MRLAIDRGSGQLLTIFGEHFLPGWLICGKGIQQNIPEGTHTAFLRTTADVEELTAEQVAQRLKEAQDVRHE